MIYKSSELVANLESGDHDLRLVLDECPDQGLAIVIDRDSGDIVMHIPKGVRIGSSEKQYLETVNELLVQHLNSMDKSYDSGFRAGLAKARKTAMQALGLDDMVGSMGRIAEALERFADK